MAEAWGGQCHGVQDLVTFRQGHPCLATPKPNAYLSLRKVFKIISSLVIIENFIFSNNQFWSPTTNKYKKLSSFLGRKLY